MRLPHSPRSRIPTATRGLQSRFVRRPATSHPLPPGHGPGIPWAGLVVIASLLWVWTPRAERFTFDESGYRAGERAPNPPWMTGAEWRDAVPTTLPMVVAGQGVGGSQCLSLLRRPDSQRTSHSSAIYVLPRRLTLLDGAQRVSLKFAPPAYLGPDHGSLFFGQAYLGSGTRNSIDFQAFSFNGVLEIDILSEPGWPCRVEFTADFQTWTPIETRTPTQATWTLSDPGADAGARFYRAVIP